jgi:aquaporin Z
MNGAADIGHELDARRSGTATALSVARTARQHWPEYLMEGAGLGLFMISAAAVTSLVEYPGSPVHHALPDPVVRRILIGLAMGLTAIGIIYSPWGKRSGAHLNPAVTLTFLKLGKILPTDAAFYMLAQFFGGWLGVVLAVSAGGRYLADPAVNYVVTVPGESGPILAFAAEAVISCGLMLVVLTFSNKKRLAPWTGVCAGCLVALYIALEAPLSGMSMNPARTMASAIPARVFTAWWVYFVAPISGMFAAAALFTLVCRDRELACPKLHHANRQRCIFCGKPRGA